MNKYLHCGLGVAMALVACSASASVVVGGTPSFTAVRAQIEWTQAECPFAIEFGEACPQQTVLGISTAQAGDEADAFAKVRSGFGVNGAYASVTSEGTHLEAYAESIWSDAFVVQGGSGSSTLRINVRVDGSLDGLGKPGGPGSNSFYALFVSDAPIVCDFDELSCTGTQAIGLTEPLSGTRYLQADIAFTYGKAFYLASYLGAEVVGGQAGVADFFHSAHIGIGTPEGADLITDSGAAYQTASAVPEADAIPMFLFGGVIAWLAASRRSKAKAA